MRQFVRSNSGCHRVSLDHVQVERSQTVAEVLKQNANLAIAFEEHTVRTLKGIDQALLFIKHEREEPGSKLDIRQLLTRGIIDNNLFTYIGMVDEQGDLTLGSDKPVPAVSGSPTATDASAAGTKELRSAA